MADYFKMNPFMNDYFLYLCDDLLIKEYDKTDYLPFLKQLFLSSFLPLINGDENRVQDCLDEREIYCTSAGIPMEALGLPEDVATVLEILVSLAKRMEFLIDGEKNIHDCFWEMVMNMFAMVADEQEELLHLARGVIDSQIDRFVFRKYNKNGEYGCAFMRPKTGTKTGTNLATTELWYQLQSYIA